MKPAEPESTVATKRKIRNRILRNKYSFRWNHLAVFAITFGMIGGYYIYQSFANTPVAGLLHANGTLVHYYAEKEEKVFLIEDGKLRPVSENAFVTHHFTNKDKKTASDADLKLPIGEPLPLAEGAVVKEGDKIYQLEESDGQLKKRSIENGSRLNQIATVDSDIAKITKSELPSSNLEPLKDFNGSQKHVDGTVVVSSNGSTYLIENGQRRPVRSKAVGLSHRLNEKLTTQESEGDRNLPVGSALDFNEGAVVKGSGETIYVIEKAKRIRLGGFGTREIITKRPIRSPQAFKSYSYTEKDVIVVPDSELSRIPIGKPLPEDPSAPVLVYITPKPGETTKAISDEYVSQGAKLRYIYPEWATLELPHDLSDKLRMDSRVQKMDGFSNLSSELPIPLSAAGCSNGEDDDGDGWVDYPDDAQCAAPDDPDEYHDGHQYPSPPPPPPPPPPPAGQPPVALTDPTIGGIPRVGETLVGGTGSWANGVSYFSFQWQRCTSEQPEGYGSGCSNISGANSQNYLVSEADVYHYLRIHVSATNAHGPGSPAVSKVTTGVYRPSSPAPAPPAPPPSPSPSAPVIKLWNFLSGNSWAYSVDQASRCEVRLQGGGIQPFTPSLGGTYTVTAGGGGLAGQLWCWNGTQGPIVSAWAGPTNPAPPRVDPSMPAPTIVTWQFLANNSWAYHVSNASYCEVHLANGGIQPFTPSLNFTSSVTAGSGNQAGQLRCWNGGVGPTTSSWAGPVSSTNPVPPPPISGDPPLPDQNPTISGIPAVGQTLRADPGSWKNGVTSFTYQWYRCGGVDALGYGVNCTVITGATGTTYALTQLEAGLRVVVKVTAKNAAGSAMAASLATSPISAATSPETERRDLSSEPASPVAVGATVRLRWYMQYGSNCSASSTPRYLRWLGPKSPTGNQIIGEVRANSQFRMTCTFSGTRATVTLPVNIASTPAPQPPPPPTIPQPSVTLSSDSTEVAVGGSVTLRWSSQNANSCNVSSSPNQAQWTGSKPVSGSQLVGPLNATTTFNISCSGLGGTAIDARVVTVTAAPPAADNFSLNSPHLARIGARTGTGSPAGAVAVIDTGVDRHPLLNVADGFNCVTGDSSPATQDPVGHGTQVAGVIGATGDGVNTPRGIAPGTRIIPIKVTSYNPTTQKWEAPSEAIACGVREAVRLGATVINLSLGEGVDTSGCSGNPFNTEICNGAVRVRIVAAAGNRGQAISSTWPANLTGLIVATGMHDTDGRAGGQNTGGGTANNCDNDDQVASYSAYSDGNFNVIAAPSCVFTTHLGGGSLRGGKGTSFAAPMVSGSTFRTDSSPAYMYLPPSNGRNYGPLLRL